MPHTSQQSRAVGCIVLIIGLSLGLQGCGAGGGGSPATTVTTTKSQQTTTTVTTTTFHWQNFSGMNCNTAQEVKAAYPCGKKGVITVSECKAKCEELPFCEGISIGGDKVCNFVKNVVPSLCENGTDTTTFIFSPRMGYKPHNATTPWSTRAEDVVKTANELFQTDDDGVLIHMIDTGLPWTANGSFGDHMSFSIMNKAGVTYQHGSSGPGKIGVYRDGSGPSILGTPTARQDMLKCFFPCDGYSNARLFQGCGRQVDGTTSNCDSEEHLAQWCGPDGNVTGKPYPNNNFDRKDGMGWPCSFRPTDLASGLKQQFAYKNGATGLLYEICTWMNNPMGSHNEAVIDGFKWNAALPNSVWAFPITSACKDGCVQATKTWRKQFNTTYGRWLPLIKFDLFNTTHPFSVFPGEENADVGPMIVI